MTLPKMHSVARLLIVVGLVFSILLGPLVADVSAQEVNEAETRLGITPVGVSGSYFELTMSPGETQHIEIELGNFGEAVVEAHAFAADAYTIINGGLGIRLDGEPTSGATHWLDYPAETLAIEPGASILRTIEVSVPDDATPGEYLTALVIQNAEPTGGNDSGSEGVFLRQVNRQAIAVAIDVPGERVPELAIGSVEHLMVTGLSVIRTEVENSGNVRLRPSGEFTVTGPDGVEISKVSIAMDSIYAGTDTRIEVSLPELLPAGEYILTLWLEDNEHGIREESGPISLSVPELVAPVQMPDPAAETESASQPVIETQIVGIPTWALLIAIPAAIVAGAALAYVALKRRLQQGVMAAGAAQPQVVVRQRTTPQRDPVSVRQMVPPARNNDATDTEK